MAACATPSGQYRRGFGASDSTLAFGAFPSLQHDTSGDVVAYVPYPLSRFRSGRVKHRHSVFLWFGKTDDGVLYQALLDLKEFPTVEMPTSDSDLRTLEFGKVDRPTKVPKNTSDIARWKDPHHAFKGRKMFSHDGSWVDCNAGCCVAADM